MKTSRRATRELRRLKGGETARGRTVVVLTYGSSISDYRHWVVWRSIFLERPATSFRNFSIQLCRYHVLRMVNEHGADYLTGNRGVEQIEQTMSLGFAEDSTPKQLIPLRIALYHQILPCITDVLEADNKHITIMVFYYILLTSSLSLLLTIRPPLIK